MNSLLLLLLLTVTVAIELSSALSSITKLHPLSDQYIAQINSKQSTWKAARYFEDLELFKILATGAKFCSEARKDVSQVVHNEDEDIPESFDAREAWPECADIIGTIRDQSRCGSCWAFAAVEAMSDRICIHSNASRKLMVSAEDLLTCGDSGRCYGGYSSYAWGDWVKMGIVTGGLYNRTDQGCKSYFLPPCEDHMHKCTDYVSALDCVRKCDDSSLDYYKQKTFGKNHYYVMGEKQMQLEIMKNGPVEVGFRVYEDFATYRSGIYQRTSDESVGGHAVKAIGWGVENGTKYWLIANSWNQRWGENGYFRILRGVDEAGIESSVDAGLPDFSKF